MAKLIVRRGMPPTRLIISAFLCFTGTVTAVSSDPASSLLARTAAIYGRLNSYRFSATLSLRSGLTADDLTQEVLVVARSSPARTRLQFGIGFSRILATCDGSTTVVHIAETNQYVERRTTDMVEVLEASLPPEVLGAFRRYTGFVDRYAQFPTGLSNPVIARTGVRIHSGKAERTCTVIEAEMPSSTNATRSKTRFWIEDSSGLILREESGLNQNGEDPSFVFQLTNWTIDQQLPDSLFVASPPAGSQQKSRLDPPVQSLTGLSRAEGRVFSLTFRDLDGATRSLDEFGGRMILLNFWASWSKPCLEQMADMDSFARAHQQDGLVVLGVTSEQLSLLSYFFRRHSRPRFPVLIDEEKKLRNLFRVSSLPTLVVLDHEWRLVRYETGRVERKQLEAMLRDFGQKP